MAHRANSKTVKQLAAEYNLDAKLVARIWEACDIFGATEVLTTVLAEIRDNGHSNALADAAFEASQKVVKNDSVQN